MICVECGNDDATEGHDACLDCLYGLSPSDLLTQGFEGAWHAGSNLVDERHHLSRNRGRGAVSSRVSVHPSQIEQALLIGGERSGRPDGSGIHPQIVTRQETTP